MSKNLGIILEKAVIPTVVAFLTPIATAVASKVITGEWYNYFDKIPTYVYYSFFCFLGLWLLVILIFRRFQNIRKENVNTGPMTFSIPTWGYVDFAEIELFNVRWRIQAPAPSPYSIDGFNANKVTPTQIEIDTPPRCLKCGTEIDEKKNFWGTFIWECIACGQQTKSKENYYTVSGKVLRIVKRKIEIKNSN